MFSAMIAQFDLPVSTRKVYRKGRVVGEVHFSCGAWVVGWSEDSERGRAAVSETCLLHNAVERMFPRDCHG